MFQIAIENLRKAFPAVTGLATEEQLQVFLLSQINFYLLLIPTMIAFYRHIANSKPHLNCQM